MKAKLYNKIQTLIEVPADFSERVIPKNSIGTIVEFYESPEGYAVAIAIPNSRLVGGFEYENIILTPDQFILISQEELEAWMETSELLQDKNLLSDIEESREQYKKGEALKMDRVFG